MTMPPLTPDAAKQLLDLDEVPDAEFMALLREATTATQPPIVASSAVETTVDELLEIIINGTVGNLLARAREQEGKSLEAVGTSAGLTRARVQQIEHSENLELATIVKVASALGYKVGIRLEPIHSGGAALVAELPSRVA